jgi:hypothetical protein
MCAEEKEIFMGLFLACSSIIGRTKDEVAGCLADYANSVHNGLQPGDNMQEGCAIAEENGNTTVFYPDSYLKWDDSSEFISKKLKATVFSFHIHDGDLWMYILYHNGKIIDKFNPIPDYWDDSLSDEEIDSWRGSAQTIADCIPSIKTSDIDRYLVRWDLEEDDIPKAYPTDEFAQEDWQLVDFMKKLKLPYPLDDAGNPK